MNHQFEAPVNDRAGSQVVGVGQRRMPVVLEIPRRLATGEFGQRRRPFLQLGIDVRLGATAGQARRVECPKVNRPGTLRHFAIDERLKVDAVERPFPGDGNPRRFEHRRENIRSDRGDGNDLGRREAGRPFQEARHEKPSLVDRIFQAPAPAGGRAVAIEREAAPAFSLVACDWSAAITSRGARSTGRSRATRSRRPCTTG